MRGVFFFEPAAGPIIQRSWIMSVEDSEIEWHRQLIVENQTLLKELEAGNEDGGEVFPETLSEIERLKAQIEQSQLIVAAHEKQIQ